MAKKKKTDPKNMTQEEHEKWWQKQEEERGFFNFGGVQFTVGKTKIDHEMTPLELFDAASKKNLEKALKLHKSFTYSDEICFTLARYKLEIEKLWAELPKNPDKDDCLSEFDKGYQKGTFIGIRRSWLENDDLWYAGYSEEDEKHHRRNFIGKLCQIILKEEFPKLAVSNQGHYGVKPLYDLFKKVGTPQSPQR